MAFTNFYMQSTGSDLNSGSTLDDAATLTYASGNWVAGTGVFTVASGNPQTDGITVGDWVSVYANGSTVTGFIGKVTARNTTTITVNLVVKFGTAPTDGTGNRTLKRGGAFASMAIFASNSAFQTGTVPVATKLNIKAGTYASTTTARTIALTGTTLLPLWFDGYKTTPGEYNNVKPTTTRVAGTDIPHITFTTGQIINTGGFDIWSNIQISSQTTSSGGTFSASGAGTSRKLLERMRIINTAANSASVAGRFNASTGHKAVGCYFSANALANCWNPGIDSVFIGCVFNGGLNGLNVVAQVTAIGCVFIDQAAAGITVAAATLTAYGNTFYSPGTNGITITNPVAASGTYINNLFHSCTTAGINNTSGTNTADIVRINNSYYNTSTKEVGFGDHPPFNEITESIDPLVNAPTDMSLVSAASSRINAYPGLYENQSYTSYGFVGAVLPLSSVGSGSISQIMPSMNLDYVN